MFSGTYLLGVMFPGFKNSHYPLIPHHSLDLVRSLSEYPQIQNSKSSTPRAKQQKQCELLLQLAVKKISSLPTVARKCHVVLTVLINSSTLKIKATTAPSRMMVTIY